MARRRGAVSTYEQMETIVQPLGDLVWGQHGHACGCQLDRQRHAVQLAAHLGYLGSIVLSQSESGHH